jgi:hypothetical protein
LSFGQGQYLPLPSCGLYLNCPRSSMSQQLRGLGDSYAPSPA